MDYPCGKFGCSQPFWFYRVDRYTDTHTDADYTLLPRLLSARVINED